MTSPGARERDGTRLLRVLWKRIVEKPKDVIDEILRGPMIVKDQKETYPSQILFTAAKMNNKIFLVELIREYPDLIWKRNDDGQTIFHIAVTHRHDDIYNLLSEVGPMKDLITPIRDKQGNNILHLVGKDTENKAYGDSVTAHSQLFSEYFWFQGGDLSGAFIAKKKDKEGQIFRFVSFKGVRDQAELELRLKKIKIGGNNPKVNVALFASENGGIPGPKGGMVSGENTRFASRVSNGRNLNAGSLPPNMFNTVRLGKSFSDILLNKSSPVTEEDCVTVDPSVFTLTSLVGRAFVGRTLDFKALRFLRSSLDEAGFSEASIQYVGGFSVIISFPHEEQAQQFFLENKVWNNWLSSLNPWVGRSLPYERITWVNIHGVPSHLLSSEVFHSIGKIWKGDQAFSNSGD
ncbi:putative ankyrin repeat-containing domain superfamily [Helianthus annuus]|nr:putative ankyrin repeat-containing domain superfamily [Helianthus annuus]